MAINPNLINTELTLEIDEEVISIADFKKASDNFLDLVREISRQVSTTADAGAWAVQVFPGSAGLGVLPTSDKLDVKRIKDVIMAGIQALGQGIRPIEFSDKAIEHCKALASLSPKQAIEPRVRIWANNSDSICLNRTVGEGARRILAPAYEEDGAIDGILERVDAHDKLQFVVYDLIDERAVRCQVTQEQLTLALSQFQRRVEVIGKVQYRADGMPVSIRASQIIPFPTADEIPGLERMRALLSGGVVA